MWFWALKAMKSYFWNGISIGLNAKESMLMKQIQDMFLSYETVHKAEGFSEVTVIDLHNVI